MVLVKKFPDSGNAVMHPSLLEVMKRDYERKDNDSLKRMANKVQKPAIAMAGCVLKKKRIRLHGCDRLDLTVAELLPFSSFLFLQLEEPIECIFAQVQELFMSHEALWFPANVQEGIHWAAVILPRDCTSPVLYVDTWGQDADKRKRMPEQLLGHVNLVGALLEPPKAWKQFVVAPCPQQQGADCGPCINELASRFIKKLPLGPKTEVLEGDQLRLGQLLAILTA
jgi:hypothetical protein